MNDSPQESLQSIKRFQKEFPVDGKSPLAIVCDDVLKTLHHYEDPQRQMSDAEVVTTIVELNDEGHPQHIRFDAVPDLRGTTTAVGYLRRCTRVSTSLPMPMPTSPLP